MSVRQAPHALFSLLRDLSLGGVELWSASSARGLIERGYPSALMVHRSPGVEPAADLAAEFAGLEQVTCTPTYPYMSGRGNTAAYGAKLPATVFAHGTFGICAELAAKRPDDMRVIGFCHSDMPALYDELAFYEPIIHRFVAVSHAIAVRLRQLLPEARHRDIVIRPYGVPPAAPREAAVPGAPLKLGYVGRILQQQKRIFDLPPLIEALAGVDFELTVIGEGADLPELRRRIAGLPEDLRARTTLAGARPRAEVQRFLSGRDVFVQVSQFEGTSIAMLEAMTAGCVPVVTNVSGAEDLVRDGDNGYLAPIGDVTTLAARIRHLAGDRPSVARLGAAARRAAAPFSLAEYLTWLAALNAEVWAESPRRWPAGRRTTMLYRPWLWRAVASSTLAVKLKRAVFG